MIFGNLRTYVFEDVLRRTLELFGYRVRHVMNITDVGHLQLDADAGDDKRDKPVRLSPISFASSVSFPKPPVLLIVRRHSVSGAW
jgi:cysteinyl-tRNA synthetase